MKKISCLIADDEPPALDLMESYVRRTPFLELRGRHTHALSVLSALDESPVDLLFLDIQMPELSGLALSRMLKGRPVRVIFTTAFDQYALEGYKVDALDYLLKPFDYETFLESAHKALHWFQQVGSGAGAAWPEYLFVKSSYKQIKVTLAEVVYFEGWKDYVKIHLVGESKPILSLLSLKSLEETLSPHQFMRVHRSFIVNLDRIESVERGQIHLPDRVIAVAEPYRPAFQHYLSQKSIN